MPDDLRLLNEVIALPASELVKYVHQRAANIVSNTPESLDGDGESWDDPEEWQMDAIELAHAVVRLLREGRVA